MQRVLTDMEKSEGRQTGKKVVAVVGGGLVRRDHRSDLLFTNFTKSCLRSRDWRAACFP